MYTFLTGLVILFAGYFIYSKYVEKQFEPDNRPTPAQAINDGVDFVPLSTKKNQMIQLLSIAGMGPILGAIQGILFGPIAFLLIPAGCILMGAVHDYAAGMISMRNNGMQVTGLIRKYLGRVSYFLFFWIIALLMFMVVVVFVYTSGDLIASKFFHVTDFSLNNHILLYIYATIIIYYTVSTMFSIDKVIGRLYPILGVILIIGTLLLVAGFFVKGINLQEINFAELNCHPDKSLYLIPIFFMTVSCGLLSGFHSTQSAVIARTVKTEKEGRKIFYAMMCVESFIAMIWAAASMTVYNSGVVAPELVGKVPAIQIMTEYFVPAYLAFVVIAAIVVLPITTGETSLRALRLTISETLKIDQSKLKGRLIIGIPSAIAVAGVLCIVKLNPEGFAVIWRYFMFVNQLIVIPTFFYATIYLYFNNKNYFITLIPGLIYIYLNLLFIFNAKIGLNLSYTMSGMLAVLFITAGILFLIRRINIMDSLSKMNVEFKKVVSEQDVKQLAEIANVVWHDAFKKILTLDQIEYMIKNFQSFEALSEAINKNGYEYYFICADGKVAGYTGLCAKHDGTFFLSKLYILKEYRGRKLATKTFAFIEKLGAEKHLKSVWLTVNKHNSHAIDVYKSFGMKVIRTEVTDIGNGFVMDDFVFEKEIK